MNMWFSFNKFTSAIILDMTNFRQMSFNIKKYSSGRQTSSIIFYNHQQQPLTLHSTHDFHEKTE